MPKPFPKDKSKRRSTEEELKRRIRKELNVPDDEYGDAILYAIASFADEGYGEAVPIIDKHKDLFCPWDGRLHTDPECLENCRKYQEELKQEGELANELASIAVDAIKNS